MQNRKCLIHRAGGYGDWIQLSSVLPFLLDKYDSVSMEADNRGIELFWNDPRLEYLYLFEPRVLKAETQVEETFKHWDSLKTIYPNHDIINFYQVVEDTCVAFDWNIDADLSPEERKLKFSSKNFYQSHFDKAGVEMPKGWVHRNTLFFSKEEETSVLQWKKSNDSTFNLILALGGSSIQKVFPTWLEGFCKRLVDCLPKLKLFIIGDNDCKNETWDYERTVNLVTRTSFRQAVHMTKYADYVLGGDTGLLVGAGMMGTPKTTLFTIIGPEQITNYHDNDFSLQSSSSCSPCYIMAYSGQRCPKEPIYNSFPICTHEWNHAEIFSRIEAQYMRRF